jgi:hypothetical protein
MQAAKEVPFAGDSRRHAASHDGEPIVRRHQQKHRCGVRDQRLCQLLTLKESHFTEHVSSMQGVDACLLNTWLFLVDTTFSLRADKAHVLVHARKMLRENPDNVAF